MIFYCFWQLKTLIGWNRISVSATTEITFSQSPPPPSSTISTNLKQSCSVSLTPDQMYIYLSIIPPSVWLARVRIVFSFFFFGGGEFKGIFRLFINQLLSQCFKDENSLGLGQPVCCCLAIILGNGGQNGIVLINQMAEALEHSLIIR